MSHRFILLTAIFVNLFALTACNKSNTKPSMNEPLAHEQWALSYDQAFYETYNINPDAHVHAQQSQQKYTGKGVKIAVIDTGINRKHFELKFNLIEVVNSEDESSEIICYGYQECSHGTAVTGIIAAEVNQKGLRGFAPEAQIIFVHLDLNDYLADSEYIKAFKLAAEKGAQVIVCSWGTGDVSPVVEQTINELATNGRDGLGIIIVFATDNKGIESGNDESMLPSVIGVGSSNEENLRSYYSNYGIGLDVLAPGGDSLGITTTDYYDDDIIYAESADGFIGSSASAPIVASLAALLLEINPQLSKNDIYSIITQTTDKIGSPEYENNRNDYYGYGKVNFDAATQLALNF